jgi:hypothetical protein
MGVATLIAPLTFSEAVPSELQLKTLEEVGFMECFKRAAREIAVMDLYRAYIQKGWTPKLAWQVRHKLGPVIVQTVTLAWYSTALKAGKP